MAQSFVTPWNRLGSPDEPIASPVPTLDIGFADGAGRLLLRRFVVDSGADVSLAPRRLCDELQLDWDKGQPITLSGISPRSECAVAARIFEVEALVPDIGVAFFMPLCFAEGDASRLLGREGFFDVFRVRFGKPRLVTEFELIEEETG